MWRKVLGGMVAAVAAMPAQAAWLEARTPHFIIYSEQRESGLARYAEQLERFDQAIRPLLHSDDPPLSNASKLVIYVLRDQGAVAALAGNAMTAGFYIPRASGPLAFVHRDETGDDQDLKGQNVFQHEYLHHLVLQKSGEPTPAWVTEGLAEFFGSSRVNSDGSVAIGLVPQYRGYDLFNDKLPLARLMAPPAARMSDADTLQVYARGWLLIHYLTFSKERSPQLTRYLTLVAQGKPQLAAATEAFGDLSKLDRELDAYLSRNRFSARQIPAESIHPGKVTIRTLGPAESAIMPWQMRSQRGVDRKTAPVVLQGAQRVAALYPSDPIVLAELAEAEQDAGDNAAAIAAADRAAAGNPKYQKALVMKARALMALAAKDPKKADFKQLRQTIAQANRLDPDNAEPLVMFYRTYDLQGVAPTRNSIEGLYYAQDLVPQDEDLRFAAVHQLTVDGDLAAAARMFGPIAYNPHATKMAPKLQAVMASLQAGKKADALAGMEALGKDDTAEAKGAH